MLTMLRRFFATETPELGCNADPIRSTDWRDAEIERLTEALGESEEEIRFKAETIEANNRELESLRKQLSERHSEADMQAVRKELADANGKRELSRNLCERFLDDLIHNKIIDKVPQPPVVTVENFDVNSVPDDVLPVGWWLTCEMAGGRYWYRHPRKPRWRDYCSGGADWTCDGGWERVDESDLFPSNITDFSKARWKKTKSATAVQSEIIVPVIRFTTEK